jgi:Zn-dependent protease
VQVRLHMFFLLFAALTLYLSWHYARADNDSELQWLGALSLLLLLGSVLLHELGHYWAAVRLGGGADQLVLGPLGGLAPVRVPFDPHNELVAIVAGPLVNLIATLLGIAALLAYQQANPALEAVEITSLLYPLGPSFLEAGNSTIVPLALQLAIWINWILFLFNLIPALPFDGGRALLTAFAISPRSRGKWRPVVIVATLAKVFAVGLLLAAWIVHDTDRSEPLVPAWFSLVLLAIFLFFNARVEESQLEADELSDDLFGYDFSQGYTSLNRPDEPHEPHEQTPTAPGLFAQWRQRRRSERLQRQQARDAEDDRRMDEILARLHETGMESLSPEDRALLNRVSARYRSRER